MEMQQLTSPQEIRALLRRHGFHTQKSLGQNFLCQSWVPEEMLERARPDRDTGVLEIGPGLGCLTAALSRVSGQVLCIERDRHLEPLLAETLEGCDNVHIEYADVLQLPLASCIETHLGRFPRVMVCANLPYLITSPVLMRFCEIPRIASVTVMVQREVAERICASAGSASYGALSLSMQWHFVPELLFTVPPDCFMPPPKVHSAVIHLTRRAAPPVAVGDEKRLFQIIRAAFQYRRKTLVNALLNLEKSRGQSEWDKAALLQALQSCGLPETVRGEALDLEQFARLSDALTRKTA